MKGEQGTSPFTISLAMLVYNVAYLGHAQSVDIPLHQSKKVQSNLWRVCCRADVGRFGQETGGYLTSTLPLSSWPDPLQRHLLLTRLFQECWVVYRRGRYANTAASSNAPAFQRRTTATIIGTADATDIYHRPSSSTHASIIHHGFRSSVGSDQCKWTSRPSRQGARGIHSSWDVCQRSLFLCKWDQQPRRRERNGMGRKKGGVV